MPFVINLLVLVYKLGLPRWTEKRTSIIRELREMLYFNEEG